MAKKDNNLNGEVKRQWGGFLIDLNVQDTLPLFKKSRVTSFRHDHESVHEAWGESRTIVTCNEADFIRYILEHSKRDSGKVCQDCWGLVIVPSDELVRSRVIRNVKNGVMIGGELVPWWIVGFANLCISLHANGTVGVRKFRRCTHCSKAMRIESDWYENLPELGTRPVNSD